MGEGEGDGEGEDDVSTPCVPDSVLELEVELDFLPELFFRVEDDFLVVSPEAPFLVLISCELLLVVVAVSVLLAQELRKATPAMQTMALRIDLVIGL